MKYVVLLYTKISIIHTAIQKRAKLQFWLQNETFSSWLSGVKIYSCFLLRCHRRSSIWIIYIIMLLQHLLVLFLHIRAYSECLLVCNVEKTHKNSYKYSRVPTLKVQSSSRSSVHDLAVIPSVAVPLWSRTLDRNTYFTIVRLRKSNFWYWDGQGWCA